MAKKTDEPEKGKELGRSESTELLENELKSVEEQYRKTREQVNRLREALEKNKQKTKETFHESKEFAEYIQNKRNKRQNQIITINEDQRAKLDALDVQEQNAQSAHEERIRGIDEEIRNEEFRRKKLLDELHKQSDAMRLKEKNDERIQELEHEYQRCQLEDAERLQQLKSECLEAKKNFKLAAQESAKESQLKLDIEARKMVAERTDAARRLNRDLRQNLVKLVGEGKHLAQQKHVVEEQQRKVKAEIQYLYSVQR